MPVVFLSLNHFQNEASAAQLSKEEEKWKRLNFLDPAEQNWANTWNEEIPGHHKNPERSLDKNQVRTWEDIEGVIGQYTDLPYPAFLPRHWDEERRHHLNYTVCSK